jgi:hypothetical protein
MNMNMNMKIWIGFTETCKVSLTQIASVMATNRPNMYSLQTLHTFYKNAEKALYCKKQGEDEWKNTNRI